MLYYIHKDLKLHPHYHYLLEYHCPKNKLKFKGIVDIASDKISQ